jgi:hypothetical protein
MSRGALITGSRRGDILLLLALFAVSLGTSRWLRAYHRITAFEITLVRIEDTGEREPLSLPSEFDPHT